MSDVIVNLENKKVNYYIGGDFNIKVSTADKNHNASHNVNSLWSLGCVNIVNKPTRIIKNSSPILDHIYKNNIENTYPHILTYDISNHLPTCLIINVNAVKRKTPYHIKVRDINDEKLVDYLEDLQHQIGSLTVSSKNTHDKFKDFVEMMQHVCD